MQIKKNSRDVSIRQKSFGSARESGIYGYCCGSIYCIFATIVTYCACMSLFFNQKVTRSTLMSTPMSPPMIRRSDAIKSSPKPRLFLHVGPQKTGSSTFQSMMDKLSMLTDELEGDNLYWRHVMPGAGDFDCGLDEWGGWHNCRASNGLKALIQKAKEEGKNLLLTDENLDENFVHGLREAIDDRDWDVTVIIMYRRIHEWLISWYNQINKSTNLDFQGKVLFNKEGLPYRTEHTLWPDQGGVHVPTFRTWYEEYTHNWEPSEFASMHRSIQYYHLYKKSFKNVLLYNMYKEESMVTDFVCSIIGAVHACDKLESHQVEIERVNGSVNLNHDIISVCAHEQGLVSEKLSRSEVVQAVTTYVQETGKVIPRKCDTRLTEQIRNWLVDTEMIMVGEQNWSDGQKQALVESYESFVEKGNMCGVDTGTILRDNEWLRFFLSLGGNGEKPSIVLHVGPVGANTIHKKLTTMSGEGQALHKDNYTMVDIDIEGDHFDCTENDCRATPKLKSLFHSLEGTRNNVLISNDNFDERFANAFKEAIDERKWSVKVVVGYIRLNQLLFMMYEREYSSENLDPYSHFWIGHEELPGREQYSKWPDQGGTPIPSFNSWFNAFIEDSDTNQVEELDMHLRDVYVSSFDDVDFYAYHQRNDLVTNFACQILPRATETCKVAKTAMAQNDNQETLFYYHAESDILSVSAYEKGMASRELSRDVLREKIQAKLRSTKKVLTRVCDSKLTKQLYDWMIQSEKAMIGDKFTSKRIAWINQDFQYLLESGKLCSLDVDTELQSEFWLSFFRDIDSSE